MDDIRHKLFISYCHVDQCALDAFIKTFDEQRNRIVKLVFLGLSRATS